MHTIPHRSVLGWAFGLLAAFALFPSLAIAQTAAEQQQIERQQNQIIQLEQQRKLEQERLRRRQENRPSTIAPDTAPPPQSVESDRCFDIQKIRIEGATLVGPGEVEKWKQPYLGKCLVLNGLNQLLRDITNDYVQRGYVTSRAYLPEQQLDDGDLEVNIVEGHVDALVSEPADSVKGRTLAGAFPGLQGAPLNIRDVEQGLDQMNRLGSNNATVSLLPGKALGGTVVQIKNEKGPPVHITVGVDNYGQTSTGQVQGRLRLNVEDVAGLSENLVLSYSQDLRSTGRRSSRSLSAFGSIPYGYWTFSGSTSYFEYRAPVRALNTEFGTSGTSFTNTATVSRVIHRDQVSKTSLDGTLTHKNIDNFIAGNRLEVGSRKLVIVRASALHSRYFWGGLLSGSVGYERGLDAFDALSDPDAPAPDAPRAQFNKFTVDLDYGRPFDLGALEFYYQLSAHAQISPHDLYSSEQLSLGGLYSVRGFRDDILLGDSGGYLRNDLSLSLPAIPNDTLQKVIGPTQLFAAYDYGKIDQDSNDAFEKGMLQGVTVGLRNSAPHFNFEAAYSHPISAPSFIPDDEGEAYVSVSMTF